jgi:integrase/recombinase XerD
MLNPYRRHVKTCSHKGMGDRKCRCPVWVHGKLRGKFIRRALETTSWETGRKIIREWEDAGTDGSKIDVRTACEAFLRDCEATGLSSASIGKYKLLTKELTARFGDLPVSAVAISDLREYRESWNMAPVSSRKKLERLRTFFRFCVNSEWCKTNPAKLLKLPKETHAPTLPFSDAEMEKITWAIEMYPDRDGRRKQVRAFVNLLRYSGLRIRDAVMLSNEKIQDGKLLLYTQKTGTPVHLPLPKSVLDNLAEIPTLRYYFWSGLGNPKSAVSNWQRSLAALFKLAGIPGHAHRFRDTFSVNLLKAGVPIESVSVLLGHTSIKTTERHYSPWVKSRQDELEAAIEKAWKI